MALWNGRPNQCGKKWHVPERNMTGLWSFAKMFCFTLFVHYQKKTCKTVCLVLVGLGMAVLTTFIVLGDAPWFVNWVTIFSWPIKAATWIGVSPDCQRHRNMQLWGVGNCMLKQILPHFKTHMLFFKTREDLILSLSSNARLLCMEARFEPTLKIV